MNFTSFTFRENTSKAMMFMWQIFRENEDIGK